MPDADSAPALGLSLRWELGGSTRVTFVEAAPEEPPPGSQLQAATRLEYEQATDPASRRVALRIALPPGRRARRVVVRTERRALAGAELPQSAGSGSSDGSAAAEGTVVVTLMGAEESAGPERALGRALLAGGGSAQAQRACSPVLTLRGEAVAFGACASVGPGLRMTVYATLVAGEPPASGNASVRLGLQAAPGAAAAARGVGVWASLALPQWPGLMASARAGVAKAPADGEGEVTLWGYVLPRWSYFASDIEAQRGSQDLGAAAEAEVAADGELLRSVHGRHSVHRARLRGALCSLPLGIVSRGFARLAFGRA